MNAALPLFAYGTLMFPDVIQAVLGRVPMAKPAFATGYERREVSDQLFPGLIRVNSEERVDGLIYDGLTGDDWARLDAYEGDFYERAEIRVTTEDQESKALTYLVREAKRSLLGRPRWDPETFRSRHLASYLAR